MKKVGSILCLTGIVCMVTGVTLFSRPSSTLTARSASVKEARSVEVQNESKKIEGKKQSEDVPSSVQPEFLTSTVKETLPEPVVEIPVVYDGLTMEQLASKLDRSLHSTLSGYGAFFAKESLDRGVDPYLALAIVLQETGCKWDCSALLKTCNNVGGMKGSPSCGGGDYKSFPTLEEGIRSYLNNLSVNYYRVGLTTPEQIGPKYAASKTWATHVNSYISAIKAS